MEKFKGKYRIPSARWATWDYSSNAAYFVTICIADRAHDFGAVFSGNMILTRLGHARGGRETVHPGCPATGVISL